jgi:oligoendopeptidase F
LNIWDRNAPLPEDQHKVYTWDDAVSLVLSAYEEFSPSLSAIGQRFFDNRWIHAPAKAGKNSGAFAHPTVPSVHPYLLLNYLGKSRDVMTLAHELGHGVHQVLAAPKGVLLSDTPLTLAETASVFGEMLTFRKMLSHSNSADERKILLANKIEDMINTVVRQIAFHSFEEKIHQGRRKGELSTDDICQMWMDVQTDSLGSIFTYDENYRYFWSYIPHFIHAPFYVYAYAFGDCLVNSLYAAYQGGEIANFEDKYLDMLKAGGSLHHSALLRPFGLDASDPAFWDKGMSMIINMIDELETLLDA